MSTAIINEQGGVRIIDRERAVIIGIGGPQGATQDISGLAVKSANLSDLTNATTARTNLGLGTASTRNVGQASGNVLELTNSGEISIGDGSGADGVIKIYDNVLEAYSAVRSVDGQLTIDGNLIALISDLAGQSLGSITTQVTGGQISAFSNFQLGANSTLIYGAAVNGVTLTCPAASGTLALAADLAALNASNLTSGTVPLARLPAATTTTAGTVPKLGATLTATDTGAPTSAQLYEAWMGAQRYSIRIRANDTSLLQSAFTGAGLAVASGVGRSLTSGATTGVARHSWNNGTINNSGFTFHQVSGVDHRAIPWGNRVEVIVRFQISAWAATTSGYIYVFFGVPTQIGADLSNRGIGFKIDAARAIKAVAHNGTSLTTSSGSLGTATVGSVAYETYRIVSDGAGAVSLYRDGTLLGSITGGPTATGAQNQCGLHVEIGNGGQSLTNTVMTGDMIISVAPTGF